MSDAVTVYIVTDDTAMAAAGQGNVLASRLIHRAHAQADWYLYAPTCALVEADRVRPCSPRERRQPVYERPAPPSGAVVCARPDPAGRRVPARQSAASMSATARATAWSEVSSGVGR
ncbi:hypothetical protein GCM10010302_44650 [Streptomyces polychromogenes]|uniref:Uncharacterized protein n=1 Tax=Streptomyces polychromogenes TaxID=67342 RepID=A0ABP3F6X9_9ACTN